MNSITPVINISNYAHDIAENRQLPNNVTKAFQKYAPTITNTNLILNIQGDAINLTSLINLLGYEENGLRRDTKQLLDLFKHDVKSAIIILEEQYRTYKEYRNGLMSIKELSIPNDAVADQIIQKMEKMANQLKSADKVPSETVTYKNLRYEIVHKIGIEKDPTFHLLFTDGPVPVSGFKEFYIGLTQHETAPQAFLKIKDKNNAEQCVQTIMREAGCSEDIAVKIYHAAMNRDSKIYNIDNFQFKIWGDYIDITNTKKGTKNFIKLPRDLNSEREHAELEIHRQLTDMGVRNIPELRGGSHDFMAMELVGKDLDFWLNNNKTFSTDDILLIGQRILETLEDMNKENFAHFDVSLDNISLKFKDNKIDKIHLIDFGHAQKIEPGDRINRGKPTYVAPEIVSQKKGYFESDIFSLGITLLATKLSKSPFKEYAYKKYKFKNTLEFMKILHTKIYDNRMRFLRIYLEELNCDVKNEHFFNVEKDDYLEIIRGQLQKNGYSMEDIGLFLVIFKMLEADPQNRPQAAALGKIFSYMQSGKKDDEYLPALIKQLSESIV